MLHVNLINLKDSLRSYKEDDEETKSPKSPKFLKSSPKQFFTPESKITKITNSVHRSDIGTQRSLSPNTINEQANESWSFSSPAIDTYENPSSLANLDSEGVFTPLCKLLTMKNHDRFNCKGRVVESYPLSKPKNNVLKCVYITDSSLSKSIL